MIKVSGFSVGDKVRTWYREGEEDIVRTVTYIWPDDSMFPSGTSISANGGDPCPTCGNILGTYLSGVDSRLFVQVEEDGKRNEQ